MLHLLALSAGLLWPWLCWGLLKRAKSPEPAPGPGTSSAVFQFAGA